MELRGVVHAGLATALTTLLRPPVAWAALLALTALRFALADAVPLSPDEAYYWVWSRDLQAGYLDHPPMVALWIAAGTALAGDTTLGIRLLSPVAAAIGTLALVRAGRCLFPGTGAGIVAAVLLNATLIASVGAITMTPDTPLLFFWSLALWTLAEFSARPSGGWLVAAGLFVGLALASKYTAALFVGGAGLWLLVTPVLRRWLLSRAAWAAAAVALTLFLPTVLWNAGHGWASFAKQGGRLEDFDPSRAARFLSELIGGQIGLATPLIFVIAVAGVGVASKRAIRTGEPRWTLLACLTVPAALVFVEHAFGGRVQANWPAVVLPAALLAGATLGGRIVRLRGPALGLGAAVAALVCVQAVFASLPLPVTADPTLLRLAGWPGLARDIEAARLAAGATFVAADNYGIAAELARDLPAGVEVVGAEPRWSTFAMPKATIDGRTGLFVRSRRRGDDIDRGPWAVLDPVGEAARTRDGLVAETFTLFRVVGRPSLTPTVTLPRPIEGRQE